MTAPADRAKTIFLKAAEIVAAPERIAYLDAACADDAVLRREVEGLLGHHDQLGSFLEAVAMDHVATGDFAPVRIAAAPSTTLESPGTVIGPYKLLQQIGEGGMGTVWLAAQTQPVQRQVALKLIKAGMDSRQVIARFEAERQALALMDHPNIARVLDAGATATGQPYFVMEMVKGVPITKYCDEHHLTCKERLRLFVPVCHAVQHAHQKGIIHRDLKPSNVLVCLYDGKPVPKVIDFGIAKATGARLTDKTLFTEVGSVVGTLEYMSPEQAELNQLDIDTRSDVYSLGVLLYELLTGSTPLQRKRFQKVAFLEVLRLIREEESPRPSARLSTAEGLPAIAANRGLEAKKLNGLVRGELDWIVMKSLDKDRNRRYETANGFALDVQRYLADEPVQACPPSAAYRLRKFARRNRGPVLAVAVVALALVVGMIGTTWGLLRATQAEGAAVAETQEKTKALEFKDAALTQVRQEQDRVKAALLRARRETAHAAFEHAYGKCAHEGAEPGVLALAYSLRKAREADLPELEQVIRAQLAGWVRPLHPRHSVFYHPAQVSALAFSPDGKTVVTGGWYSAAQLWEVGTGRVIGPSLRHQSVVSSVAFSPDGKTVLTGSADKTAQQWEVKTGKPVGPALQHQSGVRAVAFSPDGKTIVTGSLDGAARLWEVETGKPLGRPLQHQSAVTGVTFSPDGKTVLTGSADKTARLWEAETGKPLGPPLQHQDGVQAVAFSPDGKTVVTINYNKAQLWTVLTGKAFGLPLNHEGSIHAVAFSPDGQTVVTGCGNKTARLWEVATGKPLGLPWQHRDQVAAVAFHPDGKAVLTASENSLWLWQVGGHKSLALSLRLEKMDVAQAAAFSPDGKLVLSRGLVNAAQFWEAGTGKPLGPPIQHQSEIRAVAFSPDGKTVLTGSADTTARLWETGTGNPLGPPLRHQYLVAAVAFSPDGKTVVTGTHRGAQLWEAHTGKARGLPLQQLDLVNAVAFSPDGKTVLTGSFDKTARFWETLTGKPLGSPLQHQGGVTAVAFSPDGKMVLTGSTDKTAHLWEAGTGKPLGSPLQHQGEVTAVAFSLDGKMVLTGSADNTARLWEAGTGKSVGPPLHVQTSVCAVAFSSDGKTVLTGSLDGTATWWHVAPVQGDVERITLWAQVLTGMELDDRGMAQVLDTEVRQQRHAQLERLGGPPWP